MSASLAFSKVATTAASSIASRYDDWIIKHAIALLEHRVFRRGSALEDPTAVRQFLRLRLAGEPHEVFAALFLDAKHRVLAVEHLFHGTIDGATVYPRVVLKRAIEHNAAAVIFCHNHPSGVTDPSAADRALTQRLKEALAYADIRVLDHFIVGQGEPYSLAEAGLL